jgi:hypothetical protein
MNRFKMKDIFIYISPVLVFLILYLFFTNFFLSKKKSNEDVEEYFEYRMLSEGIYDKREPQNSEDRYLVSENYLRYKITQILDSRDVTFEKKISVLNLLDSLSGSSQDEINGEKVLDLNDFIKILDKIKNNSINEKQ